MQFADILIQHAYSRRQESFTYKIPETLELKQGDGVIVPFQKGEKPGLVLSVHNKEPRFETKEVLQKLTEELLLEKWQIQVAEWISEYYFCSKYDALKLFLPKQIFKIRKRKNKDVNKKNIQTKPLEDRLTTEQKFIVKSILEDRPPISLIHGVTGAGKTEIYTHLIKNCIQNGGQALVLVPEIALTPQLLQNFQNRFARVAVIHSSISDAERAATWQEIRKGNIDLILGSRSALFSPFKNLKLIVMDEEHEWSYKQDQSPRYHARTVLLKIAALTGAQVVFGSATPSLETMYAAKEGSYRLFTLTERVNKTPLPKVVVVDMREEIKGGNFSLFSTQLEQKIRSTLAAGEQTILFLNRRGSASSTVCRDCGFTAKCTQCELPLTYHAKNYSKPLLICHHCGHTEFIPTLCPSCKSPRIRHLGLGTERVETELQKLFPTARIARADKDTMSKRGSHEDLHERLNTHKIDILIGTQMIGKGFDIAKVSLVGILMADLGLHIPDFRTTERMFELLTQVAGRAGRREKQGEVILQSYNPTHPAVNYSKTHDYNGFYEQEICTRKEGEFPPFSKIIKIMVLGKTNKEAQQEAELLKKELDSPEHLIFCAPALFAKVKNKYQWNILIQGENPHAILQKVPKEKWQDARVDVDPLLCI